MPMTKLDAPEKPQGQDLIDLLLDPERTRQHLAKLEEAHRFLDAKLAALATLDEAEALRAQASAALSEANSFRAATLADRREASTFLARALQLAEEEANGGRAGADLYAEGQRRETQARADSVQSRERAVTAAEQSVLAREAAAKALTEAAARKADDAQRLAEKWDQKLAAFRAIANE